MGVHLLVYSLLSAEKASNAVSPCAGARHVFALRSREGVAREGDAGESSYVIIGKAGVAPAPRGRSPC